MSLRIPLTRDQTLQVEFHEIERRLRRLERSVGDKVGSTTLYITGSTAGPRPAGTSDTTGLLARIEALEVLVADLGGVPETPIFKGTGDFAAKGLVPQPEINAPPTGIGEQYLEEDATWSFPYRGVVQLTTPGDATSPTENLNVSGSLTVNSDLSARDIEAREIRTLDGVTLEGDSYQRWSDERGLVLAATDGTQTEPPYDVVSVEGGLHVAHDLSAADVECYSLHTHGDIEYGDSFWDDLRFPATGFNPAGSTAPPAVLTTNGLLSFNGTADNIIGGVAQMPHAWKEGTAVGPHVHLVFPTANPGTNTRWKLEYNVANVNDDFTTDSVTYTALTVITVANPNNVARHVLADFEDIPMTGKTVSACILWRLSRLAASDAADDDTNDCTLVEFDLHYERDAPGSSSEYVK